MFGATVPDVSNRGVGSACKPSGEVEELRGVERSDAKPVYCLAQRFIYLFCNVQCIVLCTDSVLAYSRSLYYTFWELVPEQTMPAAFFYFRVGCQQASVFFRSLPDNTWFRPMIRTRETQWLGDSSSVCVPMIESLEVCTNICFGNPECSQPFYHSKSKKKVPEH